jgi:gliding motility-associated-like protein
LFVLLCFCCMYVNVQAQTLRATLSASDAVVCRDVASPILTFTGADGMSPYIFTYTINGGAPFTISTLPSDDFVTLPIPTSTAGTYTYTLTNISDNDGNTVSNLTESVTIVVAALPTAAFTFTSAQCTETAFTYTGSPGNYNYVWDFGDGTSSSNAQNPTHKYTDGTGSSSYNVTLTVTDKATHCIADIQKSVLAYRMPDAHLGPNGAVPYVFMECSADSKEFKFTNLSSTKPTNTEYQIDWGDATPPFIATEFNGVETHLYSSGASTLTFTVKSGTCSNSQEYVVFIGNIPGITVSKPANTTMCVPGTITFPVAAAADNPPGITRYTATFGDGSDPVLLSDPLPPFISHTYENTSCGYTAIGSDGTYPNSFQFSISAENYCGRSSGGVQPIYISEKPKATIDLQKDSICVETSVCISATDSLREVVYLGGTNSNCVASMFIWKITPNTGYTLSSGDMGNDFGVSDPSVWISGSEMICLTFTDPGSYTVSITLGNKCGMDTKDTVIYVEQLLGADFTPSVSDGCASLTVDFSNTTDLTFSYETPVYEWNVTYQDGNCGTSSSYTYVNGDQTSESPSMNFNNSGSYSITLSATNVCGTDTSDVQIINVKDKPKVSVLPMSLCQNPAGTTVTPTAIVDVCGGGAASYTWTFAGGTPATSNSATPSVTYTTSGAKKIELQVANTCGSVDTFATATIHEAPVITAVSDKIYCNGDTVPNITFSATNATTYKWANSNTAIGLAATGTGAISSFTAANSGVAPITATITVTPYADTCAGVSTTFTITVYPSPSVQFSLGNQTICSADVSQEVTLSSATSDVVFAWTASTVSGITGIVISGAGTIPAQTLTNTTNAPITVYYIAKATLANPPGCVGASSTYSITVNPVPAIDTLFHAVCSGSSFSTTPVNGGATIVPVGATYSWAVPDVSGGLTGGAVGNNASAIFGTLTNPTNLPHTATYTVTPKAGVCVGDAFPVIVTVYPKPFIGNLTARICSDSSFSIVPTDGSGNIIPAGTTYNWGTPVSNPLGAVTGGAAASSQTTIGQTLTNVTSSAATLTYTVTPVSGAGNSCAGNPFTIAVTVLAAPSGTISGGKDVCIDSQEPVLTFTGSNGVAPYTFTYTINGGSEQTVVSTGNSATLSVPTSSLGTYIYTLVRITESGDACAQIQAVDDTVTVLPSPIIPQSVSMLAICVGGEVDTLSVSYTDGAGTPTYQWYKNNLNTTIGGTSIPGATADTYTPPSSDFVAVGTYYYYVTIAFLGSGCDPVTAMIAEVEVVLPPSIVTQPIAAQMVCPNMADTLEVVAQGGVGTNYTYQWYADYVFIVGATDSIYLPPSGTSGTITYYCVVSQSSSGCSVTSADAVVEVVQGSDITAQPQSAEVCRWEDVPELVVVCQSGIGSPSYQWYQSATNGYSGTAIAGATTSSYTPPSDSVATIYYYCIISFTAGTCNDLQSDVVYVTVNPVPIISDKEESINSGYAFTVAPVTDATDTVLPGTTYTWEVISMLPAGGVTGASDENTPQTSISQALTCATDPPEITVVTYRVTPETNGCEGSTFDIVVTVHPPFNPDTIITHAPCYYSTGGGSIELTIVGGVPPYTVAWTGPDGFTSDSASIYDLAPGVYTVLITESKGLTYTHSYTITTPDEFIVEIDDTSNVTCYGAMNGAITVSVSGGTAPYTYEWTKDGDPFAATRDLSGLAPGSYVLTVTDDHNCNPATVTAVITEPELLIISMIKTTDLSCFEDSSGVIEISVEGGTKILLPNNQLGYSYSWIGANGFTSNEQNLYNLPAGEYRLTVEDAYCSDTASYTLTQPAEIVLLTDVTPITCYHANDAIISVRVVSGGFKPFQAVWNNYAQGFYKDNVPPGTYVITVTDSTHCSVQVTVDIVEPPLFTMSPVVQHVSCYDAKDGSIRLNFAGGVPPVQFAWEDDPMAGADRTHLAPGTYTIHISDAQPCRFDQSVVIIEPFPLTVSAAITDAVECSNIDNGAIVLTVLGGTAPYHYLWSTDDTLSSLANLPPNNYMVEVTDEHGCKVSEIYTIQSPSPITVQVETAPSFDCETNSDIQISTAKVSGGTPPYIYDWSHGTPVGENNESMITGQVGMASVAVTDKRGCYAAAYFDVSVSHGDYGIVPILENCTERIYSFEASFYNTQPTDTYLWDFGDGRTSTAIRPVHQFLQPGIDTVRLTVTSLLCTYTYTHTLLVEGFPEIMIYPPDPKLCPEDSLTLTAFGGETYLWNDGSSGNTLTIYKDGAYTVRGISPAGCVNEAAALAELYPVEIYPVSMNKQEITNKDLFIQLWTKETPTTLYTWDFGDGAQSSGNPVWHTYPPVTRDMYYTIKLSVVNSYGCLETSEAILQVDNVLRPNTFSPNGDGVNDLFMAGWKMEVYNRNGVLFYKGNEGWDGTYHGKPVSADTYFYCIFDSGAQGAIKNCGYITIVR